MTLPNTPQPGSERALVASVGRSILRSVTSPVERVVQFFGTIGSVAILCLLAAAFAFFWAWQHEEWQAFVSATAGGLAALLAALTRLLKDEDTPAKWVLTIGAIAFSAAFSWYTTTTLTNKLAEQADIARQREARVQLLKDDIVEYVRPLSKEELARVLTEGGAKLRARFNVAVGRKPPFRDRDFEASEDIIYVLQKLDRTNGHAIYISGEIERMLGGLSKGRQRFYEYLELEGDRTRSGEIGVTACRNAEGFCRERTAWIFHLLANDFYAYGKSLKLASRPAYEYTAAFSTALKHACSAIELFPPDGFNDALQAMATRALEKVLSDELGQSCPPKAKPE